MVDLSIDISIAAVWLNQVPYSCIILYKPHMEAWSSSVSKYTTLRGRNILSRHAKLFDHDNFSLLIMTAPSP